MHGVTMKIIEAQQAIMQQWTLIDTENAIRQMDPKIQNTFW